MLCGIDEAGRGCLAGDLVVAACVLKGEVEGLADSKKLNEKKREALFEQIIQNSLYEIVSFSSDDVDKYGLSSCIKKALVKIRKKFFTCKILFDGNTNFGVRGIETLIKADSKIKEVSAASILAKVTRDRLMKKYHKMYPKYGFNSHKGYGTKLHVKKIQLHGLSPVHRKTFKIKSLQCKSLFDL